ncbi:hypothetical protein PAUR_a2698 [Pseudoalteromonas aurantia 208]|uniref:Uncharacterized protein n=1 Tax=Pseudoalteromonas aurantia 208 TaxID=1314867 RepID=A0ABR9EDW5_9GAMM|nr:hypothetical protein [Pseudoalteromonas aurantia 208]
MSNKSPIVFGNLLPNRYAEQGAFILSTFHRLVCISAAVIS